MTLPNKKIGDVLLKVDNISLSFGGVRAIRDVTFEIREHEILAIIGPNGAGKTSMLNVINGFYHPQVGTITYRGVTRSNTRPYDVASQGVARTFQNVALFKGMSVLDNIMTGRLPYGLQKGVELARALASEPQLLLLDEPMAGMNVEEKEDMCRFILDVNEEFGTTIALIEHDMGVVMDICDRIVVLDYGRKIADGPPDAIRNDQAVIDAYLGLSHDEPAEQSGVAARTPAAAGAGGGS
jgi:branched-chain amino acid transport system ATP-binding protein